VEGAGVGEVVAADHADVGIGDGGDDRAGGAERGAGQRDIVGLPGEWEELQPEVGDRGAESKGGERDGTGRVRW